ncbi:MAG TPA: hypothetical protein PK861_11100, partial [Thermomonas sp.]|nr:hypothetical protein [Thermomonas sp.]
RKHFDSVAAYVPDDAPVAFRGSAPDGPGYWFPPTVLTPARGMAVAMSTTVRPLALLSSRRVVSRAIVTP